MSLKVLLKLLGVSKSNLLKKLFDLAFSFGENVFEQAVFDAFRRLSTEGRTNVVTEMQIIAKQLEQQMDGAAAIRIIRLLKSIK